MPDELGPSGKEIWRAYRLKDFAVPEPQGLLEEAAESAPAVSEDSAPAIEKWPEPGQRAASDDELWRSFNLPELARRYPGQALASIMLLLCLFFLLLFLLDWNPDDAWSMYVDRMKGNREPRLVAPEPR